MPIEKPLKWMEILWLRVKQPCEEDEGTFSVHCTKSGESFYKNEFNYQQTTNATRCYYNVTLDDIVERLKLAILYF